MHPIVGFEHYNYAVRIFAGIERPFYHVVARQLREFHLYRSAIYPCRRFSLPVNALMKVKIAVKYFVASVNEAFDVGGTVAANHQETSMSEHVVIFLTVYFFIELN
jgi:hypothetical protein